MPENKTFVIDTNVLLHDPDAIWKFDGHQVVIPMTVIEELDRKKKLRDELGNNSRLAIRFLDSLKEVGKGNLHRGGFDSKWIAHSYCSRSEE